MYVCVCIYVWFYECLSLYINIYLCLYMYQEFPKNWYKVMRGQTSGRGKQGFSYKCYIFLHGIATVATNSVYVKYMNGFKVIWKYLFQKYNKEYIFCYSLLKGICNLIFDFNQGGLAWRISPKPPPPTWLNSVFSARLFIS